MEGTENPGRQDTCIGIIHVLLSLIRMVHSTCSTYAIQAGVVEDNCNQNAHEAVEKGFICLIPTILHRETLSQKQAQNPKHKDLKKKKKRKEGRKERYKVCHS